MSDVVKAYKSGKSLIYIESKFGVSTHEIIDAVDAYNKKSSNASV